MNNAEFREYLEEVTRDANRVAEDVERVGKAFPLQTKVLIYHIRKMVEGFKNELHRKTP